MDVDEEVYLAEKETGHRNRALAYFLKDLGVLRAGVEETLDYYFRQCALRVTCVDLARMGLFLAAPPGSPAPVCRELIRMVNAFMVTCGMYNGSGEFAVRAGIPAKSGVSGAVDGGGPRQAGRGGVRPGAGIQRQQRRRGRTPGGAQPPAGLERFLSFDDGPRKGTAAHHRIPTLSEVIGRGLSAPAGIRRFSRMPRFLAFGGVCGWAAGGTPDGDEPLDPAARAERYAALFETVWLSVYQRYVGAGVERVDWFAVRGVYKPRVTGARDDEEAYRYLEEMVALLEDPLTFVRSPAEAAALRSPEEDASRYSGVGILLSQFPDGSTVVAGVFDRSPAARGGVRKGERIVAVDGEPAAGKSLDEVAGKIQGPVGSQVALTLADPWGAERTVTLRRAEIQVPRRSSRSAFRAASAISPFPISTPARRRRS